MHEGAKGTALTKIAYLEVWSTHLQLVTLVSHWCMFVMDG